MKVAITGSSGSIASYLMRELQTRGWDMIGVGRTPHAVDTVPFAEAQLDDPAALARAFAGVDAVVHLAAVPRPLGSPAEMINVNVTGTAHVLEAAVSADVPKVVFASSGAATGFSFQQREIDPAFLPLDEDHPAEPQDPYGLSKLLGELTCARWTRAHALATVCLRINHNWCVDHGGAELALTGGWARGMTLNDLWQRYRSRVVDDESELASTGSILPRHLLWAVSDPRDTAQAFRLALENTAIDHEVFQINGSDTCSLVPSEELVARWFPGVPLRRPLPDHASLVSHDKATRLLNYQPQFSWRDSDFAHWLAEAGKTNPVPHSCRDSC